jgi:Arc/MetJ family transcription regulator
MGRKVRTNIVIDEDLVDRVKQRFGLASKREAVEYSLRAALGLEGMEAEVRARMLAFRGSWSDVTDEELKAIYGDDWWGD